MPNRNEPAENTDSGSRADEVHRLLRQEIVRGDLLPREALSELEIAERLRVSRTAAREALQRLAAEGLIRSHRRRWVVHEHTKDEIRQIYEVRAALEGYSARLASLRATDAELAELTALRDQVAVGSAASTARVEFNERVHDSVLRLAHNESLFRHAAASRLYFFNRKVAALYTTADLEHSAEQHRRLLEAIQARRADDAERIAREHVDYALELIIRKLD